VGSVRIIPLFCRPNSSQVYPIRSECGYSPPREKVPFHAFGGAFLHRFIRRADVSGVEGGMASEGEHPDLAGSIAAPKQQPAVTQRKTPSSS
jgi:hypothetical protein